MPSTTPLRARWLPAVVAALALALAACGNDEVIGDEPLVRGTPTLGPDGSAAAPPSGSPREQDEAFGRIDDRVRRTYFPRPPRELRRWESTRLVSDEGRSVVRAAFPCESGFLDLGVDSSVLGHAETLRTEGDFLVSQQLTVYPVGSRAGLFAEDLEEEPHACGRDDGRALPKSTSTAFDENRSFGVKDRSTVYSESVLVRSTRPSVHLVDLVTVRGNAVVWTRIASERRVRSGVVADKDRNPAWVEVVRAQGNLGVRALAALRPTRR